MRIERSVTTVSWIPSDLLEGMGKMATRMKLAHHDPPPPDSLGSDTRGAIEELREADRFRFANELRAYIEVDDAGNITDYGYCGGGVIGGTTIGFGVGSITIPAVKLTDRCSDPVVEASSVTFTQAVGGRTGAPMPRAVKHPPFIQYHAPIVWTTLQLTIHTDGTHEGTMIGASGFPRHWLFDDGGHMVAKSSVAEYKKWMAESFGRRTPWGDEDSPALITEVESLLERELQESIMRGDKKPDIVRVKEGKTLVEQGSSSDDLYLLLNGVLVVEVDGEKLAEMGPGAVFGERAALEGGTRTATLRAVTDCKVAVAPVDRIDHDKLAALASGHRREEARLVRVHLCGVRGSTPAVGAEFTGVGGNTSCVALAHDDEAVPRLVLDAGTGLRAVSALLGGEPFRGSIMLGHLHWDHTQGLPFFRAADRPDAVTRVLIPEQGRPPLELLERFMGPPAFPLVAPELQGSWTFDSIDEGIHHIEGFTVLAREIPHKGGRTLGYRVSDGHSSIAYLSDHGPARVLGPGPDGFGPYHEAAIDLCDGVDLLIHDAQYTASELPFRIHFGHSAADYAVGLARRCGAGGVLLFHHDPDRTDTEVAAIERAMRVGEDISVDAAREGDTIWLGQPVVESST